MNKRQVGSSDLYISELSLGCMSLGTDEKKAQYIIDQALDAGINYLDTADLYDFGQNERIVGQAIKEKRDNVILATKVGNHFEKGKDGWYWDPSKEHIKEGVKQSLTRLGTDYIDLYQLHGGTIEDNIDETIEAFEELKKEGVIRYYGISSIRPNVIREYVKRSNIVSVMMQYSLFDRRPEESVLDLLHENNISVMARGSLAKGMLSDSGLEKSEQKAAEGYLEYTYQQIISMITQLNQFTDDNRSLSSLALQYVLYHPALASAVIGTSSIDQLQANLNYTKATPINEAIYEQLKNITKPVIYQKHR